MRLGGSLVRAVSPNPALGALHQLLVRSRRPHRRAGSSRPPAVKIGKLFFHPCCTSSLSTPRRASRGQIARSIRPRDKTLGRPDKSSDVDVGPLRCPGSTTTLDLPLPSHVRLCKKTAGKLHYASQPSEHDSLNTKASARNVSDTARRIRQHHADAETRSLALATAPDAPYTEGANSADSAMAIVLIF